MPGLDWSEKTVLITGGTGSFGRAFVDTVQRDHPPKKIIIFSRDEVKQSEMAKVHHENNMRYFIGDVRDDKRLRRAFQGVDIVVHAAALKQVPATEFNPFEAVRTNILGAENIIDAAIDEGVERVLALSTDKAVNPINLYGATKLCAEKLFVDGNVYSRVDRTRFSVVRYGNVLASRGSVLLHFLDLRKTGRLPITDERMTRFCITLEQGVSFVTFCLENMAGAEIFVPKIPSMSIMDLAEAVAPECSIEFTGIRPGEKLHEELISSADFQNCKELKNYFIIYPFGNYSIQKKQKNFSDSYDSYSNKTFLSLNQLKSLIKKQAKYFEN